MDVKDSQRYSLCIAIFLNYKKIAAMDELPPAEMLSPILGLMIGIGLSAAAGYRAFVPFLVMAIAARTGYLELSESFEWIVSWPAIIAFGTATLLEIGAYYLPWIDNLMDTIATPTAVVAGVIVTGAIPIDMHPLLQWGMAVVAGGGTAGIVQTSTVLTRGLSTVTTAGVANPVLSTAEAGGAITLALMAILLPIVAFVITGLIIACCIKLLLWKKKPPLTETLCES